MVEHLGKVHTLPQTEQWETLFMGDTEIFLRSNCQCVRGRTELSHARHLVIVFGCNKSVDGDLRKLFALTSQVEKAAVSVESGLGESRPLLLDFACQFRFA